GMRAIAEHERIACAPGQRRQGEPVIRNRRRLRSQREELDSRRERHLRHPRSPDSGTNCHRYRVSRGGDLKSSSRPLMNITGAFARSCSSALSRLLTLMTCMGFPSGPVALLNGLTPQFLQNMWWMRLAPNWYSDSAA